MDRDHLTRLIDDPARVQRDDIADLQAMAERYPWFSGAHLLLAVGGHREGDVLFDEQLRASAAHMPSRAVLFDRLHTPLHVVPDRGVEVIADEPVAPKHEGTVRSAVVEEPLVPAPEKVEDTPVVAETAPLPEPQAPATVVIPVEAEASPVQEPVLPAVEEETPAATATDEEPSLTEHIPTPWKERLLRGDRDELELDRQMRDSAVSISYELLLEREGDMDPPPVAAVPEANTEPVAQEVPPPAAPKPAPAVSRSFGDWLSAGSDDVAGLRTPAVKKEAPPAISTQRPPAARPIVDPEIIRAVHALGPVETYHAPETPETKALIDRFLQQNTQLPQAPKKAEFFNPQTAAKRSLEEHADLVTETLARIYEKQGNIAKAIAAYERLAVKHPEKSAHFRALAKALSGR